MSTVNSFDKNAHFSELNSPLFDQTGVLSPSTRKALASTNLGFSTPVAVGGAEIFRQMPVPSTATASATLTTAQILNGVLHGNPGAAVNYTLPLASDLATALPDFEVGDAFQFTIVNLAGTATFDITVVTNTGWTLVGPTVVGAGASAAGDGTEWTAGTFRARKTAAATFTLYRVG